MPSDERVLAYAAGIVDGEGSISISLNRKHKYDSKPCWHALSVRVTNTDPRLPEWLQRAFGGTIHVSHKGRARQAPASQWALYARAAEAFLRAVWPYLIIKQDQADVAISLRETMKLNRSTPLTDEIFAYRESLRAEMRRLQTFRRLAPIEEAQNER